MASMRERFGVVASFCVLLKELRWRFVRHISKTKAANPPLTRGIARLKSVHEECQENLRVFACGRDFYGALRNVDVVGAGANGSTW
jgi:hypothetical protein